MNVETKAAELLERLMHRLGSEQLDYQSQDGVHEFLIHYRSARFKIQLTDEALQRRSVEYFEEAVGRIAEGIDAQRLSQEPVAA